MAFIKNKAVSVTLLILVLFFAFSFCSCLLSDYSDTIVMIPSSSQMVFNLNLQSFFKRKAILGEFDKVSKEPSVKEFLKKLQDLAFVVAFSSSPYGDLDLEKDLLPYLNTNFSIGFYEIGDRCSLLFNNNTSIDELKKKTEVPYVIVFDVKDKEGVLNFLGKLEKSYNPVRESYKNQEFFSTKKSSYFINDKFLVFASNNDILKQSIDCIENKSSSMEEDKNFVIFKNNKLDDETIGFVYWNIPSIGSEFTGKIPGEYVNNWKDLFSSMKFMGTSIELDSDKLKFNTYLVHSENLSPLGKEFFSLSSKKLRSLEFYPEESSCVMALSDPSRVLSIFYNLFKGLAPGKIKTIVDGIGKYLGYSPEDIFSYLAQEMSFCYMPSSSENINITTFLGGSWFSSVELIATSPLNKTLTGVETLLTTMGQIEEYKDVDIISVPKVSINYSRFKDFLLLSSKDSKEDMKKLIDTYRGDNNSIESRVASQTSTSAVGILYLNVKNLYNTSFIHLVKDEELRDKLQETFDGYPEAWGSINSAEDGYVSTMVMPF